MKKESTDRLEYAIVTGGSKGIGYAISRELASRGYGLILVARHREELEHAARSITDRHGVPVEVRVADLSDQGQIEELHRNVKDGGYRVKVLVNNAGFGDLAPFTGEPPGKILEMIRLNAEGLSLLSRLFAGDFVEAGGGRILNVSSLAAYVPGPGTAVYAATKAFVRTLSISLASELRRYGVVVSVLCPGPVRTEGSFDRVRSSPVLRLLSVDGDRVARIAVRDLHRGRVIIIPGLLPRIAAASSAVLPAPLIARIAGAVYAVQDHGHGSGHGSHGEGHGHHGCG